MYLAHVISGIKTGTYGGLYNPENFFVLKEGTGAGNNWAAGYARGGEVEEEVMEMIEREADGSDSLEVGQKRDLGEGLYSTDARDRGSCSYTRSLAGLDLVLAPSCSNGSMIGSPKS